MTILLKGGSIVNVFSNEILRADVLISDNKIIGVGDYSTHQADSIVDLTGKFLCPGLIDGHIHIESTMMLPYELSKACLPCGTTTIIADPHEIANVCGKDGINFMIEQSKGLPFDVFFMLPSCVPATNFDETGAKLDATDLNEFYSHPRVLGLAEMMNYVGVCKNDDSVMAKIEYAKQNKKIINGHAPLLCGKDLDKYISVGIQDDHECSNFDEALEKLRKGQKIMIRQGSTAKNLISLLPLFDSNFADRCMLVSDDKHPSDFLEYGHIDSSIRLAIKNGKNIISAIKMATIVPAQHFGLSNLGAIAPGYSADIVVFDSTENFNVLNV
ncbi:MAG: adenine deaminase, partial [Clostridiales bacterium]|nr:adenine deaminase [Clostridiales bacterium]